MLAITVRIQMLIYRLLLINRRSTTLSLILESKLSVAKPGASIVGKSLWNDQCKDWDHHCATNIKDVVQWRNLSSICLILCYSKYTTNKMVLCFVDLACDPHSPRKCPTCWSWRVWKANLDKTGIIHCRLWYVPDHINKVTCWIKYRYQNGCSFYKRNQIINM